jgi:phosphatidylinositol dimannoside acyltransferase
MRLSVRLAYPAYRWAERVACALPPGVLPLVKALAATIAVVVLPNRRRMVGRHQRRVRGPEQRGWALHRASWRAFRSYASYWLDTFRMCRLDHGDLARRFEVNGLEHLDKALASGRGAVLATPHLGSWDLGGAWLAGQGYPLTAVVERLEPPELLAWFCEVRRRAGLDVTVRGPGVWERLEDSLAHNRVVVLVCDRDLSGRGVEVRFFGERTTLPVGPAKLALRCRAPLLPVGIYERGGGRHRGLARPPVSVEPSRDQRGDVAALTQRLADELEDLIRQAPEQWHLTQPNWPSDRSAVAGR